MEPTAAIALLLGFQVALAVTAYAAWERRNSEYQYAQGQLDTVNDPHVVDQRHVDANQEQRVADEEHQGTVNSLVDHRTIPNVDEDNDGQ